LASNRIWRLVTLLVLLLGGCAEGVAGAAEGLFAEAWRNEAAGAPATAVAGYTELTTRFPESPLAPIARERVAGLAAQLDAAPIVVGNAFEPGDFV